MNIDGIGTYKYGVNLDKVDLSGANKVNNSSEDAGSSISVFGNYLTKALDNLNDLQQVSENDKIKVASGQADNLAQVMINSQKAEVSLQYAVQLRNKVVDAYNEIMRMTF